MLIERASQKKALKGENNFDYNRYKTNFITTQTKKTKI